MSNFFSLIISGIWVTIIFIIFSASIDNTTLYSKNFKMNINLVFPEGWSFFTKSPREEVLKVYKIKNNNEIVEIGFNNQSYFNYFGFSRKSRVITYESSIMASQVKRSLWEKHYGENIEYFNKDTIVNLKLNKEFKYLTEGDYIFKLSKPIPFVWRKDNQNQYKPYETVRVTISKSKE